MATRCFSPPDSFRPRSPTMVSKPSGIGSTALSSRAMPAGPGSHLPQAAWLGTHPETAVPQPLSWPATKLRSACTQVPPSRGRPAVSCTSVRPLHGRALPAQMHRVSSRPEVQSRRTTPAPPLGKPASCLAGMRALPFPAEGAQASRGRLAGCTGSLIDVHGVRAGPPVGDVVEDGVIEEHRVLGHDCHVGAQGGLLQVPHVDAWANTQLMSARSPCCSDQGCTMQPC